MRPDLGDLRQHQLEPRARVRRAGYGRVLVLPHDGESMGIGPLVGELTLLLDVRLVL